jgi:PAS domain S-box-containing protein
MAAPLPRTSNEVVRARAVRSALLLCLAFAAAYLSLGTVETDSRVPTLWPVAGILVGLCLTSVKRARPWILAVGFVVVAAAHLLHGYPVSVAAGFAATSVASASLTRRRLLHGLEGRRAALLDQGDVGRLVGAITVGSLVAAVGYGLTDLLADRGNPFLGALAAFGAYAAALMVLLPLFLETPDFEPLAGGRERAIQSMLTLGTTVLVFWRTDVPPVMFAVMPMFAWYAFRGTLREATLLLTLVGAVGTVMTGAHLGPIWGLTQHYDIAPEFVSGVLQLFLVDCGLILLPLSVMATQQRKAAARAAAERETLQRLVAAATGTAVIATGRDGRILLFNPGAEGMLGYAEEDVLGELPDRFHTEEELLRHAADLGTFPSFADICAASVERGDRDRLWTFRRPDGEERKLRMTLTPVPDDRGRLSGYLATADDVTEREAAHAALLVSLQHERTAAEQLRELERVKGDFVSTVSHELRTPITSILGYTELLEDGALGELAANQRDVIARVGRNSQRLLHLVEDLLTLSQIEAEVLTIDPIVTDLRVAVRAAYDAVAQQLSSRSLTVALNIPDEPVVHECDPVQLERMVVNLLSNAVKFTPDGGRVDVDLHVGRDSTEIVVQDTGLGIPEEEQAQLFTRFFRSSTASEHAIQGTGLGLTIVKAIVTLHGGGISVRSAHERGTTVTVSLPRSVALAAVPV